jgi:nitrate/nitrite-specific signal transduction histidine kinase
MGLKIMEYRARIINGILKFKARPKGGTRVSCLFPHQGEHAL